MPGKEGRLTDYYYYTSMRTKHSIVFNRRSQGYYGVQKASPGTLKLLRTLDIRTWRLNSNNNVYPIRRRVSAAMQDETSLVNPASMK